MKTFDDLFAEYFRNGALLAAAANTSPLPCCCNLHGPAACSIGIRFRSPPTMLQYPQQSSRANTPTGSPGLAENGRCSRPAFYYQ